MNARLFILAILTLIIAALFMSVSAPAEDTVFRMTLGGDCSADRATGDLYQISDRYCIVDEGTGSVPAAPAGRGERVVKRGQGLRQGYVSVIADDRGNDQGDNQGLDISTAQPDEQGSNQGDGGSENQIDEQPKEQTDDISSAQNNTQPKNDGDNQKDKRGSTALNDPVDEQAKDKRNGSSNTKVDKQPKDQDDPDSSDKKCKKAERDNVNSQGNHNCSADNPDTNSGQERTIDHGQPANNSNAQIDDSSDKQDSSDKECKQDGRDNLNSQGNHNCSADNPDTNSDQQRTTDHGQSDQAQGDDPGKNKEKKNK